MIEDILSREKELYNLGREYCLNGINLDNIPDNYKDDASFLSGYKDALLELENKDNKNINHRGNS